MSATRVVAIIFPNSRGRGFCPSKRRWNEPAPHHILFYRDLLISLPAIHSSSKSKIAAAMVVVQFPFFAPTADWVTLAVRTILFEMR